MRHHRVSLVSTRSWGDRETCAADGVDYCWKGGLCTQGVLKGQWHEVLLDKDGAGCGG